jgi:hypothetical protein
MKTIQLNLYPFAELSAEGRTKALSDLWDANVFYDWWQLTYDDAKEAGLTILGFDIDKDDYCKVKFNEDAIDCASRVIANHGEQTATYIAAQSFRQERDKIILSWPKDKWGDFDNDEALDAQLDKIEANFLRSMSYLYLSIFKQAYGYLTSEAAIIEAIETNEYFFTAEGNLATALERLAIR